MVKGDPGLEVGVSKVAIKSAQGGRHGEALVGNEPAGKSRDVKSGLRFELPFDFTTDKIKEAFEVVGIDLGRPGDEKVVDHRLGQAS